MIDIHTHALPRFDDGAKDVATASAMLEMQLQQGVKTVALTPHYYGKRFSPAQFLARREENFNRLREHVPEGVEIRLGAEVHFTGVNTAPFEELCKLAIEGTKYILIEFPFKSSWTRHLLDALGNFIDETGYIPIIAHVERYDEILRSPALITKLADMGCLIQVNGGAFINKATKSLSRALLKHGLVHCIGSDAHDTERRCPNLAAAKERVKEMGFSGEWERAQEIMRKVLSGEQVCVERSKPIKKFFGKYM